MMSEPFVLGAHQSNSEAGQLLSTFWPRVTNDIRTKPLQVTKSGAKKDEPIQELPLARIKKIMKQDGDVKMISAEAPILFSKAAEIFISELSLRAWIHTEDNKRRTLQRNDIAMAITKYDQFDFLIDIVPRDELKPVKRQDDSLRQSNVMSQDQVQYLFQLPNVQQQQQQQTANNTQQNTSAAAQATQIAQLPAGAQIFQQPNGQVIIAAQPHQIAALTGGAVGTQGAQLVQIAEADDNNTSAEQTDENHQETTQQNSRVLQNSGSQSTSQVQYSGAPQIQFVRIPQNNSGTNSSSMSQVIGIQTAAPTTSSSDTSNAQDAPQIQYQNMQSVYVMSEQENSSSTNNQARE